MADGGSIILTGSVAGSKGRVNVLSPGPIQTPGFDVFANPDVKKSLVPLGRTGRRNRQSRIILASDDSSFVAGIELLVDGGSAAI